MTEDTTPHPVPGYARQLSVCDDIGAATIALIRGADHQAAGDDAAFRRKVREILDAWDQIKERPPDRF